jgi:hypothetical protein
MNITGCLCIVIILFLIVIFIFGKSNGEDTEYFKTVDDRIHSFKITNYLVGSAIQVLVQNANEVIVYDSGIIKERGEKGVSESEKLSSFKSGNLIKIYTVENNDNKKAYSEVYIDTKEKEFIKSLNIGMITTRFTGSTDSFRYSVTASVAVSGQPWIKIHNLTQQELRLNGHISVPPNSAIRYEGYLDHGIPLGTYFRDDSGKYPEFQYLQPHSDLYYGVVSDLKQSLHGPWQYGEEFSDNISAGQTLWPLELGYY